MAVSTMNLAKPQTPTDIPQLSFWGTLTMFAWPAIWYSLLIYVFGPMFLTAEGTASTWFVLTVFVLGGGAELVVGLMLLHREGYPLSVSTLRDRLRLHWPKGWKTWTVAIGVLIIGVALSMAVEPLNAKLAAVPGFEPPSWWPAGSNPTVEVNSVADAFPDVSLAGNYGFVFLYFVIGLVFNIFGEEIYYRGYLLPRMRGVFGRWDWVANGLLFALKHVYQRWLYPGVLVGSLCFAFAAGPLGSLPLAILYHWVGNYLLQMLLMLQAAMG